MKIKITAVSNVGKERSNNEDSFIICPDLSLQDWILDDKKAYIPITEYGSILVVADGMGGTNAGEIASLLATKAIKKTFSTQNLDSHIKNKDYISLLEESIHNANKAIVNRTCKEPNTIGMGTTIVVCWIINNTAYIAWCGDSRCYVYNPSKGLKQVTKDHSYIQELIDEGKLSSKDAFLHPYSNVITKGLGDIDVSSTPDIVMCSVNPDDILLLCSDGLCGYNTDKEIEHIFDVNFIDVIKCRDELLALALNAGGYDNICISLASLIGDNQNAPLVPTAIQKFFIKLRRVLLSIGLLCVFAT